MSHRRKTMKKKNLSLPKPKNAAKPKTTKMKKSPRNQPRRPKRSPPAALRKPQRKSPNLKMLKRNSRKRKGKRNLPGRLAAVLPRLPVPIERSRLMLLVKMRRKWMMLRSLLRRSRSGVDGRRRLPNLLLSW